MGNLKVGAFLSSFKLSFEEALAKCAEIGVETVEFEIGEYDKFIPYTEEQVKEIKAGFAKYGIGISSICAEVGGFTIEDRGEVDNRVVKVKTVIDNAVKLGTKIVQFHIGKLGEGDVRKFDCELKNDSDPEENLVYALKELDAYAKKAGVVLATETGPEPGCKLAEFIKSNGFECVAVNFDPANLCMNGFDVIQCAKDLKGLIVQTHAKDGIFGSVKDGYKEVALGEGDVPWEEYLKTLKEQGFEGNFIIERECGDKPSDDIAKAAAFLKNW